MTSIRLQNNDSYVELEHTSPRDSLNITVSVKTLQRNGIIYYSGDHNGHLALELFRGRLRVSFDIGNYPVSTMFSYELISDGIEHRIEVICARKKLTLTVDNGVGRSIINEGKNDNLKIISPIFLGGIPTKEGLKAIRHWHLRNTTSLSGRTSFYNIET